MYSFIEITFQMHQYNFTILLYSASLKFQKLYPLQPRSPDSPNFKQLDINNVIWMVRSFFRPTSLDSNFQQSSHNSTSHINDNLYVILSKNQVIDDKVTPALMIFSVNDIQLRIVPTSYNRTLFRQNRDWSIFKKPDYLTVFHVALISSSVFDQLFDVATFDSSRRYNRLPSVLFLFFLLYVLEILSLCCLKNYL